MPFTRVNQAFETEPFQPCPLIARFFEKDHDVQDVQSQKPEECLIRIEPLGEYSEIRNVDYAASLDFERGKLTEGDIPLYSIVPKGFEDIDDPGNKTSVVTGFVRKSLRSCEIVSVHRGKPLWEKGAMHAFDHLHVKGCNLPDISRLLKEAGY